MQFDMTTLHGSMSFATARRAALNRGLVEVQGYCPQPVVKLVGVNYAGSVIISEAYEGRCGHREKYPQLRPIVTKRQKKQRGLTLKKASKGKAAKSK